jgi:hypothetical protein
MQSTPDTTTAAPAMSPEEEAYLRQLSPKELKSYQIAKSHLTMSFDLSKSNGFLQWKKDQKS